MNRFQKRSRRPPQEPRRPLLRQALAPLHRLWQRAHASAPARGLRRAGHWLLAHSLPTLRRLQVARALGLLGRWIRAFAHGVGRVSVGFVHALSRLVHVLHLPGSWDIRRAPRPVRIAISIGVVAVIAAALLPILTGRTTPRWYRLQAAKLAVRQAQDAGADDWAPQALGEAKAMLQVALVEHRQQELDFLPLRDFTQAETLLRDAEAKGRRAATIATERRINVRHGSQEAISRAAQAVGRGVEIGGVVNLGSYDRMLLQKSKLSLEEAELLQRSGHFELAAQRARTAAMHASKVSDRAVEAAARYRDADNIQVWRRDANETIEWSRANGAAALVVYKEKHVLMLYRGGKVVKSYAVDLGYNSVGDKARAGDAATPEGRYRITSKKPVGSSNYHMALLLDYPNAEDRRRFEAAKRAGHIAKRAALGGLIEIHGDGGKGRDWTKGCVALSNGEMEDLFTRVAVGTPVTIVGGDGNGGTFTKLVNAHRATSEPGMD